MTKKFNIIQIWIEDPNTPTKEIKKWMESVINNIPEGSTYTLVSTNNYFPSNPSVTWIKVSDKLTEMQANIPIISDIYFALSINQKSEILRMYLGGMMDNIVYLDCDMSLTGWPEDFFLDGKPFMYQTDITSISNCAFVVNDNKTKFIEVAADIAKYMKDIYNKINRIPYGSTFKVINVKMTNVNKIDSNLITYHR